MTGQNIRPWHEVMLLYHSYIFHRELKISNFRFTAHLLGKKTKNKTNNVFVNFGSTMLVLKLITFCCCNANLGDHLNLCHIEKLMMESIKKITFARNSFEIQEHSSFDQRCRITTDFVRDFDFDKKASWLFQSNFWPLYGGAVFFEEVGTEAKIGRHLKSNCQIELMSSKSLIHTIVIMALVHYKISITIII